MRRILCLIAALALSGCASGVGTCSDPVNPFGWPAKVATGSGLALQTTAVPFLREFGRLLYALGDLLECPALALESLIPYRDDRLAAAGEKLLSGAGGTLGAAVNLPFFFVTGRNVDLGRDAAMVNEALAHLEKSPPASWHQAGCDRRVEIFPRGTRVHPWGTLLVWTIPGVGDVLQAGEESPFFRAVQAVVPGTDYSAQERSWGMIVANRDEWDSWSPRMRAATIIHEFVHQHVQIGRWFRGFTVAYWPAYGITFLSDGWEGHWAERTGPYAAEAVDLALRDWQAADAGEDPVVYAESTEEWDIAALKAGEWIETETSMGDFSFKERLACVGIQDGLVWIEKTGGPAGQVLLLGVDADDRQTKKAFRGQPGQEGREIKIQSMPAGETAGPRGAFRISTDTIRVNGTVIDCDKEESDLSTTITWWSGQVPFHGWEDGPSTRKGKTLVGMTSDTVTVILSGTGTDARMTLRIPPPK